MAIQDFSLKYFATKLALFGDWYAYLLASRVCSGVLVVMSVPALRWYTSAPTWFEVVYFGTYLVCDGMYASGCTCFAVVYFQSNLVFGGMFSGELGFGWHISGRTSFAVL